MHIFLYLESSFELGARLVHGLVPLHELHDEDGEVLVGAGADGDGHGAHAGRAVKVDLGFHVFLTVSFFYF